MATCKHCGDETELYSNGIPICLACAAKFAPTSNDVQLGLPHE